jgi:tetratricopeptide (TPR) repeat protein
MEREEEIELIERYLKKELSEFENTAFQQRLLSDRDFKVHYDEVRTSISGIQYSARKAVLEELKKFDSTLPGISGRKGSGRTISPIVYFGIAASILILVVSTVLIYRFSNEVNPEQLYQSYYTIYPNIVDPTQRNDTTSANVISPGFRQYDLGNYEEAVSEFNESLKEGDNEFVLFYLAISYLELNRLNEAIEHFHNYIQNYSSLKSQAQWYLALSYIKNEQLANARIPLQLIAEDDSSYSEKASNLLNQLE